MGVVLPAFLLLCAPPMVLRFGARYAVWLEQRVNEARVRDAARRRHQEVPQLAEARPARIASVAVVDDELLVQLVALDGDEPSPANYWLNARSAVGAIEAAERSCTEGSPIQFRLTDSTLVLLQVGDKIVPMLGSAAQAGPSD